MSGSQQGRRAVITGAAGGIGRAMAELFAAEGAEVFAVDLNRDGLAELADSVPGITPVAADISTERGAAEAIEAAGGRLDALLNNAGVLDGIATVEEVDPGTWQRVIAVNLTAPYLLCRAAIPVMVAGGGGAIVNTASVAGLRGGRAGAAYTASKFGLVGLTQNVAVTHGPAGIRCNAICPGGVNTGIHGEEPLSETAMRMRGRDREKPQPASPEEVASVALFLCGEGAGRLNGAAIPVDAGWIAY